MLTDDFIQRAGTELEMQRRALVALKVQQNIDRRNRIRLITRLKKERDSVRNMKFKLKLAISASLILSIASFFMKL